jgi:hypothetical protein
MSALDSQRAISSIFGAIGVVSTQIGWEMAASHTKSTDVSSKGTEATVVLIAAGIHTPVKSQTTALGP